MQSVQFVRSLVENSCVALVVLVGILLEQCYTNMDGRLSLATA